jgi:predicted transcriptional regulator
VIEIRARWDAGGVSQRQLAAEYSVSQTLIRKIVQGKVWLHLLLSEES